MTDISTRLKSYLYFSEINRLSKYYFNPAPAAQVMEIIEQIPRALGDVLKGVFLEKLLLGFRG